MIIMCTLTCIQGFQSHFCLLGCTVFSSGLPMSISGNEVGTLNNCCQ